MWPVPFSYERRITSSGPGSFWEDRLDRFHCGFDIYGPWGSPVIAFANAEVLDVGEFTSPELIPYWRTTYYVDFELKNGLIARYAELDEVIVKPGSKVNMGDKVGWIGLVINKFKVDYSTPAYVRNLKSNSMLHFELWKDSTIINHPFYLGGNWFSHLPPENLLDPSSYLRYEV